MNKALLRKWAWRFGEEDNSAWKNVISLKYGTEEGGWFPRTPKGNAGVGLWKGINAEAAKLKQDLVFELGEGKRIGFWEDVWCGEVSLCASFLTLCNIARTKGAKVAKVWESSGEDGAWNMRFSRAFNEWELDQVQNFIMLTNNKLIILRKKDRIVWKGNKNGQFSMKVYCSQLEVRPPLQAPTNIIWSPYVPTKVGFFAWKAWWGKVLTMQQLKKRGYQLASRCPFCRKEEEGLDHILIHCPSIWDLWVNLISVLGVSWFCPYAVKDLI